MDEKSHWLRERLHMIVAALAGAVAGISCMSIGIGNKFADTPTAETASATGTLKQEGTFNVLDTTQKPTEVYYPRPYASPPNLQLSTDSFPVADFVELIDQKADHFTYRRLRQASIVTFKWRAEGVPTGLPATTTTTLPVPTPANELSPAAANEGGR